MKPKLFPVSEAEQWGPIDMRLIYPSFWFGPMSGTVKSKWGIYWARMYGIMQHDQGTFYWERGSLENEGIISIKRWLLPSNKRKKVISEYWPLLKKIRKVVKDAERLGPNAPFDKIRPLALKWHKLYYEFWSLADVFEIANYGAPIYLKEKLVSLVPAAEIDKVMEVLLAPEKISFNQQSQKELLELRLKARSDQELKKLLTTYASRWFWLNNSYYESLRLDADHFYQKTKSVTKSQALKQLQEIKTYPQRIKNNKRNIAKQYRLPRQIAELASVLSLSIWLQDDRKAFAWWSSHAIDMFSKHLAVQLKAPIDDIQHYLADEWLQAYRTGKPLPAKTLAARKSTYVMYSEKGFYTIYTGKQAKKFADHFLKNTDDTAAKQDTLRGIVVSKGPKTITGTVRVLRSARESAAMRRGEILVTSMTSPDYIHAMRLAKAIITDVGGLMSHAAVVSRELGTPCIVGTKIATQILKDGDKVQIDPSKGIIKKLS